MKNSTVSLCLKWSAILNRTLPNDPCLYEMEESLIEGVLEKYCVLVEGSIIVDI